MNANFPPPDYIPTASAIEGIQVFMPAPVESTPQPEVVAFHCPQCGANTAFSAADGGLTCSHCGYYEAPERPVVGRGATEFEFTVETVERAAQGWGLERKEMACQHCGAVTTIPAGALTHTCAFCGSNKVIQRVAPQDVLRPRFLIPFSIETAACQEKVREWLSSSWMTPGGLKSAASLESFTAVYLPFWTFDAHTRGHWRAEVGYTHTERYYSNGEWKTRTKTVWRWESGQVEVTIDDLLIEGTTRVSNMLLNRVKDYNLGDLRNYDPKYLAGMQAQAYDVPLEKAWEAARQQMRERNREACIADIPRAQYRNFSMTLDFADETWRYILLPVYLNSYQYGGQSYQVLVNGQSGTVAGQRPVDWNKVWLAIAALVAPGLLLGLAGLLTLALGGAGVFIGGFGFILLVIGLIISVVIFRQADAMDDA